MSLIVSEAEWLESKRRTDEWVAGLPDHDWLEMHIPPETLRRYPQLEGQRCFEHRNGRRVIVTVGRHDSGGWWLHVSLSRANRIPSYEDLADVKRVFVGDGVQALQIFPKRERHVNIMPYCLHLWARVDAPDGLPDFGKDGSI